MHRKHAVENLGRNEVVVRNDELYPYNRGFNTPNDEEQKRVEDVQNPQLLVIHSDNPVVEPVADRPCAAVN